VRRTMELPTVTIVYGDDAMRASLRFLLEVEGWDVCEFNSPATFPEAFCPQCLVLEQDLPGMAGLDLVEELRRHGKTLPVVLTTQLRDAGFLARATAVEANVVDSMSPAEVIRALRAVLAEPVPPSQQPTD
jgi:FixJ family two-component response regulator